MAALDFPNSPTPGQQYNAPNSVAYTWDGATWTLAGPAPSGVAGGDLTGTYPNPQVTPAAKSKWAVSGSTLTPVDATKVVAIPGVNAGALQWGTTTAKGRLIQTGTLTTNAYLNVAGSAWVQDDAAKHSWLVDPDLTLGILNTYHIAPAGTLALAMQLNSGGGLVLPSTIVNNYLTIGSRTGKGRLVANKNSLAAHLTCNASLNAGETAWAQDDVTKPSWLASLLGEVSDAFLVARVAPGGAYANLLTLDGVGNLVIPGSVTTGGVFMGSGARGLLNWNADVTFLHQNSYYTPDVASKQSWMLALNGADAVQISRRAPNAGAGVGILLFHLDSSGNLRLTPETMGGFTQACFMTTNTAGGMRAAGVGTPMGDGLSNAIAFGWDGTVKCRVDTTPVGTVSMTSDERLKLDVQEDVPGLDAVLAMRPISFEYDQSKRSIGFPRGRYYGLAAQEIKSLAPLAVGEDDSDDHWKEIDYRILVPVLIRAVQELTARMEAK